MRYLALLLLAGCVNGTPYGPTAPCPNVIVYVSFADSVTLVTDSINYPLDCKDNQ